MVVPQKTVCDKTGKRAPHTVNAQIMTNDNIGIVASSAQHSAAKDKLVVN